MIGCSSKGEYMVGRRRSCGNAEIGVVLSDTGKQQAGTLHQMDDVTAEVDEREEYSNDFDEETASRGACKLSDLAKDKDTKLLALDSELKKKENRANKTMGGHRGPGASDKNDRAWYENQKQTTTTPADGCI